MTRQKSRVLLAICGWLVCLGWSSSLEAAGPRRLPGVPRIGPADPVTTAAAAESAPASSPRQPSFLSQPEYTQTLDGSIGPVPVENLVAYALASNPEIRAARNRARALGAQVPQVSSLPDPRLTTVTFLQAVQTAAGPQEVIMGLSQYLPWFGKLPLRSQVAYHNAMAAYAEATAVELGVIERVKRAYYDVYFFQRSIEVILALEPRIQDVIDITKTKYENNQAGLESVLQAQIKLASLKTRLIELRQTKIEAQARLAAILHLSPQTRIDAVAKFDPTKIAHTARLLVELAESYRPELEARRREYSRDQASIALARRDYWPDVTVGFNWYEIGTPGLSPVTNGEDAYALAVGVNLPLYRQRLDAAVREAQHKTARSAYQYEATLDDVRREVVSLYAEFIRHQGVLEILGTEIVPDAEKTLDLSIEHYDLGRLQFQQMIDSYEDLLEFQIDYYKREALREQAIASLERAVGRAVTRWPADNSEPAAAPMPPPVR